MENESGICQWEICRMRQSGIPGAGNGINGKKTEEVLTNQEDKMRKGNYGFNLWFYPAVVFVLAIFGQTLLSGLVTIFAIALEKDEWTSRQTMEAFFLGLVNSLFSVIIHLFDVVTWIPFLGTGIDAILGFCSGVISLLVLIIAVVGVLRVSKGEEARIPVVEVLVNKIFA